MMIVNFKHSILRYFGLVVLAAFISCGDDYEIVESKPIPLTATINLDSTYQTISGFGGANRMWGTQFLKPAEAKKAFGNDDTDLGMTLFRVRIASNRNEWPLMVESAKEAQKYGAKILASPWSPPAALKNNNSDIGGHLLPQNFAAFKDHINDYLAFMKANGVDIYAISIQNEPDIQVSYESCDWTAQSMINFLKEYGHQITGAKIAAPESFNFNRNYTNAFLNDADAAKNIDIVAGHVYGGGQGRFPLAEQQKKEIWMTEYLLNLNTGQSGAAPWSTYSESAIWDESITMLLSINESMKNNWNAYIWWYLQRYYSFIGDGEQGTPNGEILKRGYAFSHFSKYIKPGYKRVKTSTNRTNALEITAYEGNGEVVVVIINPRTTKVFDLHLESPSISSAVAYETSLDKNRARRDVKLDGGKAVLDIEPKSVVTVVLKK